jgi:hypothetical protein
MIRSDQAADQGRSQLEDDATSGQHAAVMLGPCDLVLFIGAAPQFRNRFVHGFVHGTRRDRLRRRRRGRPRATSRANMPRSGRQLETPREGGDVRRMAHNPEVAGSNPAPATKFAGERPLPIMEGAFCVCRVHGIVHEASEEGRAAVAAGR